MSHLIITIYHHPKKTG